jgi:hypothetical protein
MSGARVVRHELLVQRLADRRGEVVGERAGTQLGQLVLYQFPRVVTMPVQFAMNGLALRHLIDVLVVHRIPVLLPVGFDVREQAPVDVEQLVVGQPGDRVVDRIVLAARPEPDMRAELVRMAGVVARARQSAHAAVLLDDGDVVAFFTKVIRHRRSGHAAAQYQDLVVHASSLPAEKGPYPFFRISSEKGVRPLFDRPASLNSRWRFRTASVPR